MISADAVSCAKEIPIESEIARRGITLKRVGHELVGPCPACGGTDRFSINTKKQLFNCRGAGGGDVIAMVQHIDGTSFTEAVESLTGETRPSSSPSPPKTSPRPADDDCAANRKRAGEIWRESVAIAGTVAERYLTETRRLILPVDVSPRVLRFHPACPWGLERYPALVALYTRISDGKPCAIHRTALRPDATKLGRMTLAPTAGAAIRISDDPDVYDVLTIGEGIETTLAGMALGFAPAWALGDAGGIAKFPVLDGIRTLTILVDNDQPDQRGRQAGHNAARQVAERWQAAGRQVFSVVPRRCGADMADVFIEEAVRG